MRILAVDYGKKRTGIAVTDPLQIISSPLTTVDTGTLKSFLTAYIQKEQVEEIVFGHPKHLDDTDADIMIDINKFIADFLKSQQVKITLWDERFTSKLAVRAMIDGGYKKKDRQDKKNIDKIAAAIILQDYMEYKKNNF